MNRPLKRIDILRHELKALRFVLDNFHANKLEKADLPARADFQSDETREIFDAIIESSDRAAAEKRIASMDLEDVDIASFLRLSGEHYYSYPALVKQRASDIRSGALKVENA